MMDTLSEFDENSKPVCHGSPRPLLELASIKMAFHIWLQKFDEFYPAGKNTHVEITKLDFHYEGSTAVPLKIQKIIDSRMYPMARELNKWVRYINSGLKNFSFDQISSRFNLVVFGGNGTVNFKDTIANFLQDSSLNILTRFEMACVNCVVEKIDFFWPLVSCTLSVDDLKFYDGFMLYYWICRKKGELHRIHLKGFSCIERLMIDKRRGHSIYSYLAVEYFLTLLNPDDRLVELDELSKHGNGMIFTCLFSNIDAPTQHQIIDKNPVKILYDFVTSLKPVEYSVQCFLYIKDIITPECYCQEVVIELIIYINESLIYCRDDKVSEKEEGFWYKQIEIALEQIWLNTPSNLKKYALENLSAILTKYNNYDCHCLLEFVRDIRFLLAALSDADVRLRNRLWTTYWPNWVVGVPPSQFEELMELCLMKPETIEKFKSTFPYTEEFKIYCSRLICGGYFIELDEFLSSLYSNHDLVLNIKKHIFANETEIFSKNYRAMEKYAKYIDNLISSNVLATDFKDNLILTDPILKFLFHNGIFRGLSGINLIISLFVSPQKHPLIKKKLLELFRHIITNGNLNTFNESSWSQFILWCTDNNKQRANDFMKSLQIDIVFESALVECLKYGRPRWNSVFTSLNKFLIWYFNSESVSENYIREKVEYYERMDEAEIERIFHRDKQIVIDSIKNQLLKNSKRCGNRLFWRG